MTKCPKCHALCAEKEVRSDRCDFCIAELRGNAPWHKNADKNR